MSIGDLDSSPDHELAATPSEAAPGAEPRDPKNRAREQNEPTRAAGREQREQPIGATSTQREPPQEREHPQGQRAGTLAPMTGDPTSAPRGHSDPDDSSAQEPAASGAAAPWASLAHVPPLGMLAAGAAICHAILFRLLLPVLAGMGVRLPPLLTLAAPYALNLTVVAGLAALCRGALELVLARDLTYIGRRLTIAMLAGMLLFACAFATFMPRPYMQPQFVLLSAGALHTYAVQVAMMTVRAQRSLAGRTTMSLLAAASLFPLTSLIVRHAEPLSRWPLASEGVTSLHALGELAYLLVPIAAAFAVVPWSDDASGRTARALGAAAVCLMAVLFGAAARIPSALYGHVMYSTLRLEWALERASLGYAVPVSLGVGAATAAFFSRDARHRQGGAGLWLWLAGGYNPLTPARILMAALAATLVCRAILGVGAEPSKKLA